MNLLSKRFANTCPFLQSRSRFIVSPERYKELSKGGILKDSSSFLVPAHEDFRVIATAVPSPPYAGRSLDPPLRSRFQIRRIDNPSEEHVFESLVDDGIDESVAKTCSLVSGILEDAASQETRRDPCTFQ